MIGDTLDSLQYRLYGTNHKPNKTTLAAEPKIKETQYILLDDSDTEIEIVANT